MQKRQKTVYRRQGEGGTGRGQRNDSKTLYMIVRELKYVRSGATVAIKSKDGQGLLTHEEQSQIWIEHLDEV